MRMLGWLNADELITYHRVATVHRLLTADMPMPLVIDYRPYCLFVTSMTTTLVLLISQCRTFAQKQDAVVCVIAP